MFNATEIRDLMEAVREKYFAGKATKPGIYYCNANDGTDFDLGCNGRVCEFYIYKKDGDGLAKLLADKDDNYIIYIYDYDNPFDGSYQTEEGSLKLSVYELACYLQGTFDDKHVYDEVVKDWNLTDRAYLSDPNYRCEYCGGGDCEGECQIDDYEDEEDDYEDEDEED